MDDPGDHVVRASDVVRARGGEADVVEALQGPPSEGSEKNPLLQWWLDLERPTALKGEW